MAGISSTAASSVLSPSSSSAALFSGGAFSSMLSGSTGAGLGSSIAGVCSTGSTGGSMYDKKAMSSCRYQQEKSSLGQLAASASVGDYFPENAGVGSGSAAAAVAAAAAAASRMLGHGSPIVPPSAYSSFQESALAAAAAATQHQLHSHHSQQQQQAHIQPQQVAVNNSLFSPHFATSSPYPSMQVGSSGSSSISAYETSTAARSCALPSPTIYPPTPPPSAPWIHPWYGGDTF
ncbi:transcription factor SOX-4-like [Anopheles nili]|uniref:transcription factor SOX-4-like n=1 Tax=Anopheles nili TaxID=185578 RepID=UPI00237BF1B0|nr:transcription factor SOX-4-like [Anopheles nili]